MASKYSEEQFKADELLLEKIYRFAGYSKTHLPGLLRAVRQGDLALESVVENAISRVGGLERTNAKGMDFTDGSDAKKVTVVNQATRNRPQRGAGFSTKNKRGVLRVVVVDPLANEVFYFRIPPEFYVGAPQKRREQGLRITFSNTGGKPEKLQPGSVMEQLWGFQVKSFSKLCA